MHRIATLIPPIDSPSSTSSSSLSSSPPPLVPVDSIDDDDDFEVWRHLPAPIHSYAAPANMYAVVSGNNSGDPWTPMADLPPPPLNRPPRIVIERYGGTNSGAADATARTATTTTTNSINIAMDLDTLMATTVNVAACEHETRVTLTTTTSSRVIDDDEEGYSVRRLTWRPADSQVFKA